MCGIVGAVSTRNIVPVLIEGLRRLEYRGYDSCGVAVVRDAAVERARTVSRVADLDAQTQASGLAGTIGVAHTRWATHGKPDTVNAHPHLSGETIALVHNGIIENYEPLREELRAVGYGFESQTDSEVVAHLIHQAYCYPSSATRGDLFASVRAVTKRLHGAYAIAVFAKDQPDRVVARAPAPRWWWRSAMARPSWLPTHWPWPAPPTASSTWKRAMSSRSRVTARPSATARITWSSARSAWSRRTPPR